uniref:Uncharacterized protein n=1 Tax=Romanomermis culicivorax TaxID=13658 RepID=A0A915INU5_ROMCU
MKNTPTKDFSGYFCDITNFQFGRFLQQKMSSRLENLSRFHLKATNRLEAHHRASHSDEFGHHGTNRGGGKMNYRTAAYINRRPNLGINRAYTYNDPINNGYSNYRNDRNYGAGYRYDFDLLQQPNDAMGFSNGGLFDYIPELASPKVKFNNE